jgi:integrase
MPLKSARKAARAVLHAVEAEARDPQAERLAIRHQEREERRLRSETRRRAAEERGRRSLTLGALCRQYIRHRQTMPSGRHGRTARKQTVLLWESMLRLHLDEPLGGRSVESITTGDFVRVLEAAVMRGGPTMGPRVRDFLSSVWHWGEKRHELLGLRMPPVEWPALREIGHVQAERERALTPREIWLFWRATADEGVLGEALRFMLLTASRVREALHLPWSELDLPAKVWRLPAARNKSGRDRVIPLSPEALVLLRRVQGQTGSERVFAGTRIEEAMERVRERMGGESWQARDLRRTSATVCARLGADPFVVGLILGHARPDARAADVTRIYLRHDYEERVRGALERLGQWVHELVHGKEPGAVVVLEVRQ